MRAGQLKERVEVQVRTGTANAYGEEIDSWSTIFSRRASVRGLRGEERFQAHQTTPGTTHKVVMRYDAAITAAHRFLWGSRMLHIAGPPVDLGGRRRWMEMMCVEQ